MARPLAFRASRLLPRYQLGVCASRTPRITTAIGPVEIARFATAGAWAFGCWLGFHRGAVVALDVEPSIHRGLEEVRIESGHSAQRVSPPELPRVSPWIFGASNAWPRRYIIVRNVAVKAWITNVHP